ncbi:hypothetical protein IGI01_15810 [Bacillus thuringiensis]|nr:hypothetical protein [Bacillus thuringiensis]
MYIFLATPVPKFCIINTGEEIAKTCYGENAMKHVAGNKDDSADLIHAAIEELIHMCAQVCRLSLSA